MGTELSKCGRGAKSGFLGRRRPFRQSKKEHQERALPNLVSIEDVPVSEIKPDTTEEGQPCSIYSYYPMTGRALPPIAEQPHNSSEIRRLSLELPVVDLIEDIYNVAEDEDDYIPGQLSAETQPKTLPSVVDNQLLRSQCPPVAHVLTSALGSAGVMTVNPEVWRSQGGLRLRELGESKALACLVFVICHKLLSKMLLKLTMVFIEYDSMKQQQELREKVGRMEFGKQVHEDCHYLYAAHNEDVSVVVTGLRGGWKTENGCYDNTFVKVLKYRKLWDGIMCITSTHFETPTDSQPELFGATFKIQQDGLVEEATTFDVCEPAVKIIAKAYLKPGNKRCDDIAGDDGKSYEVTSSSGSSNGTEATVEIE